MQQFKESFAKFQARQPIILAEIESIEKEMSKKLTMDNLVTGFDKTV